MKQWKLRGLGYEVRHDWLGGNGGGHCLVRGASGCSWMWPKRLKSSFML